MSEPVIDLRGVDFAYTGVPVLQAIDLQVADGEFLGEFYKLLRSELDDLCRLDL